MLEVLIPLLAALTGAFVGALGSVATVFMQTRAAQRSKLTELALQAAIEQYKADQNSALELSDRGSGAFLPPLEAYLYKIELHTRMIYQGKTSVKDVAETRSQLREVYKELGIKPKYIDDLSSNH